MFVSPELQARLGPMTQGTVCTDDGAQLLYQTFGDGPAILCANGIGVRYPGLTYQIEALRPEHRIICWDYRGMGQSVMPDPGGDVTMRRHARDALLLMDALGVERAVFLGWSMGVQVTLEAIRLAPERVAGFVALFGTHGQPFRTAFPLAVARGVEWALDYVHRQPRLRQGVERTAVALPRTTHYLLSKLLFVGADADPLVFAANVRAVAGVEPTLYGRTLRELARHDASDVLAQVRCPTLIISAELDYLTPPRVAAEMAAAIAGAEHHQVDAGTHFSLIEQPERVNRWIGDFLRRAFPDAGESWAGAAAPAASASEAAR